MFRDYICPFNILCQIHASTVREILYLNPKSSFHPISEPFASSIDGHLSSSLIHQEVDGLTNLPIDIEIREFQIPTERRTQTRKRKEIAVNKHGKTNCINTK